MVRKMFGMAVLSAMLIVILGSCSESRDVNIIPYPNQIEVRNGSFDVRGAEFICDPAMDAQSSETVKVFAEHLRNVTGVASVADGRTISFITDTTLAPEAYTIDIRKNRAEVKASGFNGFLYGIETLKQMLPVAVYGNATAPDNDWTLPAVRIKDAPRFGYRGMHLDVARHFFDVGFVKKYLDIMAIHKMNVFHWHLSDDQGWRIESKLYPRLTEVGSMRSGTCIRKEWNNIDGIPYGGFYTQEEIREVVAYAASKGITVIPEIDLPGHMLGALAAYPEFGCTGGPYEVWTRWGISPDVLCVGNEDTMVFLENLLGEIAVLFPGKYFHIGGDECPKIRWENCPKCQAKIKELGLTAKDGYKAEHFLQSYVMNRMGAYLATKGKKTIGWDEILEGNPDKSAAIMSWRGSAGGIAASKAGCDVIMTPNNYMYLDYYQAKDKSKEPFAIGGYLPLEKVYSYNPYEEIGDEAARSHILGVQANLWTEYIASPEHVEYMAHPRQAALSEVQWCQPENKSWDRFVAGLRHEMAIYDMLGYNYSKTILEITDNISVDPAESAVILELHVTDGAEIRYTLDGSKPTEDSHLYQGPVTIKDSCTIRAVALRDFADTREYNRTFTGNKAFGHAVVVDTPAHPAHKNTDVLTDGVRGIAQFDTGDWFGSDNNRLSLTIDMAGEEYSSVILGCLAGKDEDIFPPTGVKVLVSEDGAAFKEVASASYPLEGKDDPNVVKDIRLTFPQTGARYIRVEAETAEVLPAWHVRAGRKVRIFVDEVQVF